MSWPGGRRQMKPPRGTLPAIAAAGRLGRLPLGGSRAAPGGPGPVGWWCGGTPEALTPAPAGVAGRGALALVLFAPRSISAYVFEVRPRSYLGCSVEYRHDLGCFVCAKTMYFYVVTLILHETVRVKSPFPPLRLVQDLPWRGGSAGAKSFKACVNAYYDYFTYYGHDVQIIF